MNQKISSNRYLLKGLIEECRAAPDDCGIICDEGNRIADQLTACACSATDIIISTGGTGQGRYDLVEPVFRSRGGRIIFREVSMRPGGSVLFGTISGKLYFAFPGPPPAVAILFRELVLPAVRKMQGISPYLGRRGEALLADDELSGKPGICTIREGVLMVHGHKRYVRSPHQFESPNCHVVLQEAGGPHMKGDPVVVHMFAV